MIKQLFLVTLGGGVGSASRYLTSVWFSKYFPHTFLLGTFVTNIIGCFVIGFLIGLSFKFAAFNNELKFLLIIGFCGGYTTFSTFSSESMKLLEENNYWTLALYIAGSVILGLIAVLGGNAVSKIIISL